MTGRTEPLNGSKTHPLTDNAWEALDFLRRRGPQPASEINPGIRDRLSREGLAEEVWITSPYRSHKGAKCAHYAITEVGQARLDSGVR